MRNNEDKAADTEMRHREITLADGRYMIFYTFGVDAETDHEENEQGEDVRTSL